MMIGIIIGRAIGDQGQTYRLVQSWPAGRDDGRDCLQNDFHLLVSSGRNYTTRPTGRQSRFPAGVHSNLVFTEEKTGGAWFAPQAREGGILIVGES